MVRLQYRLFKKEEKKKKDLSFTVAPLLIDALTKTSSRDSYF